jgi:hypothetical protein
MGAGHRARGVAVNQRGRSAAAALAGVLLCAGQGAIFFTIAADPPPPFEVTVRGPPADQRLSLEGQLGFGSRARKIVDDETAVDRSPAAAGLRRVRWRAEYRGGYHRSVGATQLVGPFQDAAAPPCGGRVVIGQRLLDGDGDGDGGDGDGDGSGGAGGLAPIVRRMLEEQLRDEGRFPVGDLRGVRDVKLRWAERAAHPDDDEMLRELPEAAAQAGYLRATAVIAFERLEVPVVMAMLPRLEARTLVVKLAIRGHLDFDNRVAQWISDLTGADRLFDTLARRQLDQLVIAALEPPPPLPLPGGGELRFAPCGRQPEIVEGRFAALQFAVELSPLPGYPMHLPPRLPPGPIPEPTEAAVALELDLNGLNALLHGAWRDGFLDRQLAGAGLDARFNEDPTVATYLSVRIDAPRLTLPPVVTATPHGLQLAAESAIHLVDGETSTLGRVWTAMQLQVAPTGPEGASLRASLHQLELTCEPRAGVLAPCYGDLVSALQARAPELDQALSAALSQIVSGIFVDRSLRDAELPAELILRAVTPSLAIQASDGAAGSTSNATLRLDLTVELRDRQR